MNEQTELSIEKKIDWIVLSLDCLKVTYSCR